MGMRILSKIGMYLENIGVSSEMSGFIFLGLIIIWIALKPIWARRKEEKQWERLDELVDLEEALRKEIENCKNALFKIISNKLLKNEILSNEDDIQVNDLLRELYNFTMQKNKLHDLIVKDAELSTSSCLVKNVFGYEINEFDYSKCSFYMLMYAFIEMRDNGVHNFSNSEIEQIVDTVTNNLKAI